MPNVHFSSKSSEWSTPKELFDELNNIYGFNLDVCATKENAKVSKFFNKEDNGLIQSWKNKKCWMNPPYGREIGLWIEKAHNEVVLGGGNNCCGLTSRAHRHQMVPSVYLQKSRYSFSKRAVKVWWPSELCAISFHGGNF